MYPEHAGDHLTWLAMWFGPATTVTSFGSIQFPDKLPGETMEMDSPHSTVACIQFASGVVARLTCGILAPHNHSLTIVGDRSVLYTKESWTDRSPVYSRSMVSIRRKTLLNPFRKNYRLPRTPYKKSKTRGIPKMDYARGPAELAVARVCWAMPFVVPVLASRK